MVQSIPEASLQYDTGLPHLASTPPITQSFTQQVLADTCFVPGPGWAGHQEQDDTAPGNPPSGGQKVGIHSNVTPRQLDPPLPPVYCTQAS
jgi:hypothetical protein